MLVLCSQDLPGLGCLCEVCWPERTYGLLVCHTEAQQQLSPPAARIQTPASSSGRCCIPTCQRCCFPGWRSLGSMVGDEGRRPGRQTPRWHDVEERKSFCRSFKHVISFWVWSLSNYCIYKYNNTVYLLIRCCISFSRKRFGDEEIYSCRLLLKC